MSNIPEARARLSAIAESCPDAQLRRDILSVVNLMRRKPALRRAPNNSEPMTAELAEQIVTYATGNPDASIAEIGATYNVNPGRVSEALRGWA